MRARNRSRIRTCAEFLGCILLMVILLIMGCTNPQKETIISTDSPAPAPVRALSSTDNSRAIEMTVGSADNFTIMDQNIAIEYNSLDGENHLLNLTVNDKTVNISVGPSYCRGEYRSYCTQQVDNVIFEIYPLTTTEDLDKDGRIGEDPRNEKDDDNDGRVDEDPYSYYINFNNWDTNILHVACFVLPEKPLEPGQGAPD